MRIDRMLVALFVSLLIVGFSQNTFAQRYEFNPYSGYNWAGTVQDFDFRGSTMVIGGRGGYWVSDHIEIEGNFGYINHFQFRTPAVASVTDLNNINVVTFTGTGTPVITPLNPNNIVITQNDPKQRGYLWEANVSYNFVNKVGRFFTPYVTGGIGGTTVTRNEDFATNVLITQGGLSAVQRVEANGLVNRRIDDASIFLPPSINTGSYLTFNYGGGLKAQRLWGPVGLRVDFIGRNLPNFAHSSLNSFNLTGGLTFAFGEP